MGQELTKIIITTITITMMIIIILSIICSPQFSTVTHPLRPPVGSQSQPAHPVTHLRQVEDTGDDDGVDDDDDDDDDDDGDNIFTSDRNQVLSTSSGTFLHGARIFAEKKPAATKLFSRVCLFAGAWESRVYGFGWLGSGKIGCVIGSREVGGGNFTGRAPRLPG